ncbi:MAG: ubiquinol-cytochrome C chaperone family protein [Pseudomonadota bacterium]
MAADLYRSIVAQSRQPDFFARLGVADTIEGRFDLILVNAFVVFRRLKQDQAGRDLAQQVFDAMFAGLDQNMREMGIGDVGILKRVRKMSESYHGRIVAYEEGLRDGDEALASALNRNLYADTEVKPEQLAAMVRYVHLADAALATQKSEDLMNGIITFPDAPECMPEN